MKESLKKLMQFSDELLALKKNQEFIESFSNDTGYSKSNIIQREIDSAAKFIKKRIDEELNQDHFGSRISIDTTKDIESIFCLLPGNAPLYALCAKVLVPSIVYNVELTISFPSRLVNSKKFLIELFQNNIPEINIAPEQNKNVLFKEVIDNPSFDTILVFASDDWIGNYIDQIKASGKKLIFEGPGNDPCIVFEGYSEANVDEIVRASLNNGGQSCSSIKRIYVKESVNEDFIFQLKSSLDRYILKNPDANNRIKSNVIVNKIEEQVSEAINQGAKITYGTGQIEDLVFLPTIIESPHNTRLVLEENFYSILPVVVFKDENELKMMLEKSDYGLNCSLFGNYSQSILENMESYHKSTFKNSTVLNPQNYHEVMKLGGFKRSGYILKGEEKKQGSFYLEDLIYRAINLHEDSRSKTYEEVSIN